MLQLTKTDFIQFLNCPQSFWLRKKRPETYPEGEFSAFLQKLVRDGYAVEDYVRLLFEARADSTDHIFQAEFRHDSGLFARADVLELRPDGLAHLYEVKSSTSVKTDVAHNHIKDACFQMVVAERAGQKIDGVSIIHVNSVYVRQGNVIPDQLLTIEDVTVQAGAMQAETEQEMEQAIALLALDEIDQSSCDCRTKSRANHCDAFAHFNADVPEPSIYSLPRLSEKKRGELLDMGILDLRDVPDDYALSAPQLAVVATVKAGAPQIDLGTITGFIGALKYPLYFFDYETYASAIPMIDGISPYEHLPVQYSLHVLSEDSDLGHFDYLAESAQLPLELVKKLRRHIGDAGSVVSWHAAFEKTRNKELAARYPDHADFLLGLNERMVDLEDLFKTAYVDARFNGYTSIKKVLPVICPELSYSELEVQDGTGAMEAWERLVDPQTSDAEREQIATALRRYCELDTFAMVEIFRFLLRLIRGSC